MKLPRSTPEAQGIPSSTIAAFIQAAEEAKIELHSFMLLRHGSVVAEAWWYPYGPQHPHSLYSLSKSFTATAVGLAVAEGLLALEDKVISFFPDDLPASVDQNLADMTVHHLLTMSSGHAQDPLETPMEDKTNWAKHFLKCPLAFAPGSQFVYNSAATYMLSAIVEKTSGVGLLEYLKPRLLEPLSIQNATWETCPKGIAVGGWGLSITTEDIAKFGQLYLQKGVWNARQLLPHGWVEQATSKQISNAGHDATNPDWQQGYGYQFWRCQHEAYRGDGAFGQYCIVMPEQDAVVAITSFVHDMQAVLNLVWKHLLPAMRNEVLAESKDSSDLQSFLEGRSIPLPKGEARAFAKQTYGFSENEFGIETLSLEGSVEGGVLEIQGSYGDHRIGWKSGEWLLGSSSYMRNESSKIAAAGAWQKPEQLQVKICYYETPFSLAFNFAFKPDGVSIEVQGQLGFWQFQNPHLEGTPL